jgi:ubiquinone/menaquinone biosynthesis C-methylase UbiE
MSAWWKAWAPYWRDIENTYLDVATIRRLEPEIRSPVLLVGAGQGLLVERLRKDGFCADGIDSEPEMIVHARRRRRLEFIEADARAMPFADESYATAIVATGVVDFLDDNRTIRSILAEAVRVTRHSGDVFIAFHKMRERVESVLRQLGMFVEDGRYYYMRRILRAEFESPRLLVRLAKADRGILFALLALLKMQFLARRRKDTLTAAAPELAPYRREDEVRQLFDVLGVALHRVYTFETCTIVQLKACASRRPFGAIVAAGSSS